MLTVGLRQTVEPMMATSAGNMICRKLLSSELHRLRLQTYNSDFHDVRTEYGIEGTSIFESEDNQSEYNGDYTDPEFETPW